MPRYKLTLEYDGRPYFGWQRQDGLKTVQGELERACAMINANVPVDMMVAGRTDRGVHATGQVAHVDLVQDRPGWSVRDALNAHLRPEPISVLSAEKTHDAFHARFDAIERTYLYRILNRRPGLALDAGRVWRVVPSLDIEAMAAGATHLLGHHDFSTFRHADCQAKSPIKTLDAFSLSQDGEAINIIARSRSFLHSQVRSMVGSLVEVGRGKRDPVWMAEILAARDRSRCGPLAPPDGLYLTGVLYANQAPKTRV
jgi:tRNA pseudouridine38-40 synthase